MARIARAVIPGLPHHVTQRGVRSMRIFDTEEDCLKYLAFLGEETRRRGVEILAYCLMPDHVHIILVPPDAASLARAVGEAHKRYTRMKNFASGARGYLFQGRFGSCALDERHLLAAARYVESNPVRAGLADAPWDYPYSSARFHAGLAEADPLVADRTLGGMVGDWRGFLAAADAEAEDALRKKTRTGRPCGEEGFVIGAEKRLRRRLRPLPPGRRPKMREKPNKKRPRGRKTRK